ncbi:hypothetical protein ACS0TY_025658 [Phlomoides rotata]
MFVRHLSLCNVELLQRLFYASEKYPQEDSYSKYISEHGGSTNAFTSSEHTNYYFDVNPDGFEEALDRFSQFFIKPLMSADATTREIKAVDSENQKNLLSDLWRMNQLQKHLSVKNHPYHKFSTGNWETLEIRPKERGVDTRQELLMFYKDYYSANLMHLVIYSKGLDKCESLVRSKFQDIRNTDRSCICFPGQPCDQESLQCHTFFFPFLLYVSEFHLRYKIFIDLQQWIERAPAEDVHLPVPNVFIPTDLSLKNVSEQMKLPVLLRKTQYSRLWYKPDTAFSSPKAYLKIDFNCPFTGSSPEAVVLTEVFTRLLMDYLNEYAYDPQVAGLYYGVSSADYGFQVTVVGYNHKLAILLETVIQRLANFEVKPDRFAVIKSIAKEYQNMKFQQPYQQAMYYCSLILQDETCPWSEELEVLPHLGAQDLVKFYPLMFSRIFVECLAAGNLLPTEAETIIQHIEDVFFKGSDPRSQPLFASQYMTNRIVKLKKGIHYFYSTEGLNPSNENSALVHYIQVGV